MVRFSCFHAQVHDKKPKKTVQPYFETMAKTLQDDSQNQASTDSSIPTASNPLFLKARDKEMNNSKNHACNLVSVEHSWGSEVLKSKSVIESECDREVFCCSTLKKSQSLESGLYQEGRLYADDLTEGDTDPGFSYNGSKSHNELTMPDCRDDQEANPTDQCKKDPNSEFQVSLDLGNGSIFSIGDPTPSHKDAHENSDTPFYGEYISDSADHTPCPGTPTSTVKSGSLPNVRASSLSYGKCSLKHAASRSRSSGDLHVLGVSWKDTFINESDDQLRGKQARANNLDKTEGSHIDSYDSYPLSGLAKYWVMPVTDDINAIKILQGESSVHRWDALPDKDFNAKRTEDWVTALQNCGPLEETNESSESVSPLNGDFNTMNGVVTDRVDGKVNPGMDAAKRYISSLSANATAAQLANHGLVAIPFLSAFASLKVLNLSGNAIVRITAGALPRGLHILNMSKNNISSIEGLRELTRLRFLDLSYNRIHRIGHGLASCSSLKELYLAGNKISEVEGLHRLLKLTVLDLGFNKISTAKCLGQLAANYNSLQAINLEGNPAQKNVGDEQLKKYLQGLLLHLGYYNQQHISSHQFDRSLRSDHKTTGKGSHGVAPWRSSSSSTHTRRSQTGASPKLSKGRQGHLPPPIGTKVSTHGRHPLDGSKLLNFRRDAIRRSCSEGTLGAL